MNSGKISYSPDYRALYDAACRAEHGSTVGRSFGEWCEKVSDYGLANARHALEVEISTERARLERAVIEAARAYGRANRALLDHAKKTDEEQKRDSDTEWQLLRDLESSWENLMLDSLDALLAFESEQEKKS